MGSTSGKSPTLILRAAIPADLPLLSHWDEQPHIIASDPNDDWQWAQELARSPDWREQLIAEVDSRAIGFVQIIDASREESHYWGKTPPGVYAIDIWIGEVADLGRGFGTQMMRAAIARCFKNPSVAAILLDPLANNVRAHRFYERREFRAAGPRRFGADECLVYQLSREHWTAARDA